MPRVHLYIAFSVYKNGVPISPQQLINTLRKGKLMSMHIHQALFGAY